MKTAWQDEPERDRGANDAPRSESRFSFRVAIICYLVLAGLAVTTLSGTPLIICLIILAAIALKTYLAVVRNRLE